MFVLLLLFHGCLKIEVMNKYVCELNQFKGMDTRTGVFNRGSGTPSGSSELLQGVCQILFDVFLLD